MYSARSKEVRSYAKGNRICGSLRESPGTLAQVAKVLGDAKVNILSSSLQHPRPRAPCRLCFRQNWVRLVKTILAHSLCPRSFQNRTCLKGFLIGDRPKRARASCLQDPNLSLGAGLRQRGTQLVKMFKPPVGRSDGGDRPPAGAQQSLPFLVTERASAPGRLCSALSESGCGGNTPNSFFKILRRCPSPRTVQKTKSRAVRRPRNVTSGLVLV